LGISPLLLKKWKILVGDLLSPVTTKKKCSQEKKLGSSDHDKVVELINTDVKPGVVILTTVGQSFK
jgi:hypothetical protein